MATQKVTITAETPELTDEQIAELKVEVARWFTGKLVEVGVPAPDTLPEGMVKWNQS